MSDCSATAICSLIETEALALIERHAALKEKVRLAVWCLAEGNLPQALEILKDGLNNE